MSIFKGTLNPIIAAQLKAREKVVSTDSTRDPNFLRYTTGKNSWVRMSSFVNYDSKNYSGDQLSRKYILEGGTLYNQGNNSYSLRAGVGNADGIYASNIDKIDSNPNSGKVDRIYGLRPMPGITSINVINKSAYGSLREATIQFYAWDKHQLEELEVLYMRTGYSVFLEWGWSEYIDHDIPAINSYPNIIDVKNFNLLTLDTFQSNLTEEAIYTKIDNDIDKAKGNYDAMLGYVKNFSWQLMSNGGFACSTTLISRGETIETLKANANNNSITFPTPPSISPSETPAFAYSVFEKIFLNIIGHVNESEFSSIGIQGAGSLTGGFFISGSSTADKQALRDQADDVWNLIVDKLKTSVYKEAVGSSDNYDIQSKKGFDLTDNQCVVKLADGKTEGTYIEYISMDAFIAIINEIYIPYNTQNLSNKLAYVVLPNITPCLASVDSVSIDPTTCLIKNIKAEFITDQTDGFNPKVLSEVNTSLLSSGDPSIGGTLPEFLFSGKNNIGQIGNIYVSIEKILDIYRSKAGDSDGVDILDLIQDVLDACSFALGSINNFKLQSNKNIIEIIDVKYFEQASSDSKFKFDLIGLKSICRDVKINSRIFAEQSTMIGIAAGDSNSGNLGDIYASTQTYFNAGLKDRLVKTSYSSTPVSLADYHKSIYNNTLKVLSSYVNKNVLGVPYVGGNGDSYTRIPQDHEIVNAGSLLKTVLYQLNGKDVDFKALIPFELEITLDGIGGLVIGQIFTIDKSILPQDYYNKNLGFIITGISHTLQNNDWITNVKTQICLLDNDKIINKYAADKDALKASVGAFRVEEAKNGYLYCALADYMIVQFQQIVGNGSRTNYDFDSVNDFGSFTKIKEDNDYMKQIINNIKNNITDIDKYLNTWYTYVETIKLKNFPSSYADFIAPLGGLDKFANFLYDYNVNSRTKSYADVLQNGNIPQNGLNLIWNGTFFQKVEEAIGVTGLILQNEIKSTVYTTPFAPTGTPSYTKLHSIDIVRGGEKSYLTEMSEISSIPPRIDYYIIKPAQYFQIFQIFYNTLRQKLLLTNGAGGANLTNTASFTYQHFEEVK